MALPFLRAPGRAHPLGSEASTEVSRSQVSYRLGKGNC